jgi:hypothetical protein
MGEREAFMQMAYGGVTQEQLEQTLDVLRLVAMQAKIETQEMMGCREKLRQRKEVNDLWYRCEFAAFRIEGLLESFTKEQDNQFNNERRAS